MTQPQLNQRLTSVDASFLYFEKKEAPLHIGGISIFESEIPYKDFLEFVSSKMPLLPRYRQKVIPVPMNLGHPTWEFDPGFNVKNHVIDQKLDPPGTFDQLRAITEKIETGMLDRNKPLWELHLVQGFEGHRTVLVSKVHHAMVDGVSGVDLMKTLLDISPNPTPTAMPEIEPIPPPPDSTKRLIDGLIDSAQEGVKGWLEFQTNMLNLAQTWAKEPQRNLISNSNNMMGLMAPISLLPFNRALSGKMRLGWANFSFAEARAIRAALGGTVNDVVLTTLSGAVINYLEYHGQKTAGRTLRVMVPVSMRREDQRGALGNLVSVLPVEIPLDMPSHVDRYSFIVNKTGALKGARVAEGINLFSALMGTVPASVQAVIGSLATTSVPPFNIVSTNVPGPQIPLYAMGRKMIASYPFVPVGFAVGVSCAILSYDQKLYFGITSDGVAMPDIEKLIEYLNQTFADLRVVAGVPETKTKIETPPPTQGRKRAKTAKPAAVTAS